MASAHDLAEAALLPAAEHGARREAPASSIKRGRALAALAAGVGLAAAAACAGPHVLRGASLASELVLEDARPTPPADLTCTIPDDFCRTNPNRKDTLTYRDCDGDGKLDAYCTGGELLRFGYLSSENNCANNWPNGYCESEAATKPQNEITILHFNDVYEVGGVLVNGVRRGGMSRAAHMIQKERKRNPHRTFAVFAGDALSPSTLSSLFQGEHMVDILNHLQLDAASLGNHEFDMGVDVLKKRLAQSQFPWVNINLLDDKGHLINGTVKRVIRTVPFTPLWGTAEKTAKVCLFGVSYDVRETMFTDKEKVGYKDVLAEAKAEVKYLREVEKCDVVLALTHQFSGDDCKFAKELGKGIDLILGGHDHSTEMNTVCGNAPYVKADSDLKTQWIMKLQLSADGRVTAVDGEVISLTDADLFDHEIHGKVVDWEDKANLEMEKKIGCSSVPVDGVSAHVRRFETNMGDLFVTAVHEMYKTDVVMIQGGCMRGDKEYPAGDYSKKTLMQMHPFGNTIVMIYMKGAEIKAYIAKMLQCWESKCGDFTQVSGLKYTFDSRKPNDQRLVSITHADGKPLGDSEELTVAMTNYMLANSIYKQNKLYNMVTLNDAVPMVNSLVAYVQKKGDACIAPKTDGRITDLATAAGS